MLMIINCTFEDNFGQNGGAIFIQGYHGIISSCNFVNNNGIYGGALYFDGSGHLKKKNIFDYSFLENLTLSGNAFVNNSATEGGGLSYTKKKPILLNNIFQNNSALYGNDISSYPVRVQLSLENSSEAIYYTENIRPSGDNFLFDGIVMEYLDDENQLVYRNFSNG
jgi:hypothetical protein